MKVGLNIGERLITMSVLPKEGSFVTLRAIRSLSARLGMTSQEIEDYDIVEKGGQVHWNTKGSVPIDFEFDPVELDLIRKSLMKLDKENKLNLEMFTVYEKFCA